MSFKAKIHSVRSKSNRNMSNCFIYEANPFPRGDTPGWPLLPFGQFTSRWVAKGDS